MLPESKTLPEKLESLNTCSSQSPFLPLKLSTLNNNLRHKRSSTLTFSAHNYIKEVLAMPGCLFWLHHQSSCGRLLSK